jgi:hypothetical protein
MFTKIIAAVGVSAGLAIPIAPAAHADGDIHQSQCALGGACNSDGWERGGCYDQQQNWVTDLPCIDYFGNWRGLPDGVPIPSYPDGWVMGRVYGGFGPRPWEDNRWNPALHGGPGAGGPGVPRGGFGGGGGGRGPEMPRGGPGGGMPRAPEMPRAPQMPAPHMPICMPYVGCR